MRDYPKLNFPALHLRVKSCGDRVQVWDNLRKIWIVLTPEEWVRQHLLMMLLTQMKVPAGYITMEYPVNIQGMAQRADVVVVGADKRPLLLVECKSWEVAIDGRTYAQGVRYNSVVAARYIMLTNGLRHYCYILNEQGDYTPLDGLPDLTEEF